MDGLNRVLAGNIFLAKLDQQLLRVEQIARLRNGRTRELRRAALPVKRCGVGVDFLDLGALFVPNLNVMLQIKQAGVRVKVRANSTATHVAILEVDRFLRDSGAELLIEDKTTGLGMAQYRLLGHTQTLLHGYDRRGSSPVHHRGSRTRYAKSSCRRGAEWPSPREW